MKSKHLRRFAFTLAIVVLVSMAGWSEATESDTTSGVLQLPKSIGTGDAKEVSVLLDDEHLKLATITLRGGTVLPTHSTPVPATIQVLDGGGVIHVGSRAVPVSKGSLVVLAAGEDHDVVPAEGSDMLLLVHYLRGAGEGHSKPESDHHH